MTEQHPADRPGHLDIDAVSAFVDRDFAPDELAMLSIHLHECPACHREVLEIRTTVVLLAGLPQYTPRRSFCLGHEHARGARARGRAWSPGDVATGFPAPVVGAPAWGAGWLPGLQAAAVVIGALLLLVTSSDLFGMPPQPAEWLGEPEAAPVEFLAAPPPQLAPSVPTAARIADADDAPAPAAPEGESAVGIAAEQSGGTASRDGASEQVPEGDELTAPAYATSAAIAAVTQAVPTPGVGAREPAATGTDAPAAGGEAPSRLRLVQIALAFALAWLVVSIVGLRWVRGVRG